MQDTNRPEMKESKGDLIIAHVCVFFFLKSSILVSQTILFLLTIPCLRVE